MEGLLYLVAHELKRLGTTSLRFHALTAYDATIFFVCGFWQEDILTGLYEQHRTSSMDNSRWTIGTSESICLLYVRNAEPLWRDRQRVTWLASENGKLIIRWRPDSPEFGQFKSSCRALAVIYWRYWSICWRPDYPDFGYVKLSSKNPGCDVTDRDWIFRLVFRMENRHQRPEFHH